MLEIQKVQEDLGRWAMGVFGPEGIPSTNMVFGIEKAAKKLAAIEVVKKMERSDVGTPDTRMSSEELDEHSHRWVGHCFLYLVQWANCHDVNMEKAIIDARTQLKKQIV